MTVVTRGSAFDKPGTWGMKHNLIWDRILGLNLFPDSIGDQEIGWYLQVQNRYGLACDNRTDQSLIDWAVWCISLAPHRWRMACLVRAALSLRS